MSAFFFNSTFKLISNALISPCSCFPFLKRLVKTSDSSSLKKGAQISIPLLKVTFFLGCGRLLHLSPCSGSLLHLSPYSGRILHISPCPGVMHLIPCSGCQLFTQCDMERRSGLPWRWWRDHYFLVTGWWVEVDPRWWSWQEGGWPAWASCRRWGCPRALGRHTWAKWIWCEILEFFLSKGASHKKNAA